MDKFVIKANTRTTTGKVEAKKLRAAGRIPAVVYDSKGEAKMIDVDAVEFNKAWRSITPTTSLKLTVDGKDADVLIKDVEYNIRTDAVLHADFFEPAADQKLTVTMKVHTTGTAAGVLKGGFMLKHVPEIKVKATLKDMPELIEADVSALNVGDSFKVGDLKLAGGVEVLTSADAELVSISPAR